jgi:hypothetical protein
VACDVIAPALIPRRAGDRIKTDRRDAGQLAVLYRADALTAIRIPTEHEEAAHEFRALDRIWADFIRLRRAIQWQQVGWSRRSTLVTVEVTQRSAEGSGPNGLRAIRPKMRAPRPAFPVRDPSVRDFVCGKALDAVETFERRDPIETAENQLRAVSDQAYFYAGLAFGVTLADVTAHASSDR